MCPKYGWPIRFSNYTGLESLATLKTRDLAKPSGWILEPSALTQLLSCTTFGSKRDGLLQSVPDHIALIAVLCPWGMQASRHAPLKAEAQQNLVALEERVEELVQKIKPNHLSDKRRTEVSNYVKDLIKRCFLPEQQVCLPAAIVALPNPTAVKDEILINYFLQVEAYMFGSVPLKTYLPDGDIDLAVFQGKGPRLRDVWTTELSALLEAEARNALNLHKVKDVQIINAEVRSFLCSCQPSSDNFAGQERRHDC